MRGFLSLLLTVVALAGAGWVSRPVALGDAGGLWTGIDRSFPALAALRTAYWHGGDGAPATADPGERRSVGSDTLTADTGAKADKRDKRAKNGASGPGGPITVVSKAAELKQLALTFEGVGTVQAIASITIRPRIDSQIVEVMVAEGAAVKAGDLLFRLDAVALKAQLAQSDAQIQKDQAQLDQAKRDLGRAEILLKKKFLTPQARETAITTVNQAKAQIAVDTAQRQGILTNLGYAEIHAPVSGRIGSIAAKAGTTVKSGDSLAVINQIDPIYISFALPQARLGDLRDAMAAGVAAVTVKDAADVPSGKIAFLENSVDTTTGTVLVRARMPNASERLWPGAFANIEVVMGMQNEALVVPSVAIQIGQKGPFVFVVRDGHAVLQPVTVSRVVGDLSVVALGLSPGDNVVVSGQMALTDGAEIASPKNDPPKDDRSKTSSAKAPTDG